MKEMTVIFSSGTQVGEAIQATSLRTPHTAHRTRYGKARRRYHVHPAPCTLHPASCTPLCPFPMRHARLSDEVKTIPLAHVVDRTKPEKGQRRGIHEKASGAFGQITLRTFVHSPKTTALPLLQLYCVVLLYIHRSARGISCLHLNLCLCFPDIRKNTSTRSRHQIARACRRRPVSNFTRRAATTAVLRPSGCHRKPSSEDSRATCGEKFTGIEVQTRSRQPECGNG